AGAPGAGVAPGPRLARRGRLLGRPGAAAGAGAQRGLRPGVAAQPLVRARRRGRVRRRAGRPQRAAGTGRQPRRTLGRPPLDPRRMMKPPSATRLTLLARAPAQPSTCLRIDPSGRILARQPLLPGQAPPPPPGESVREVVAVPGESVRLLWLELPARHPAQALAAARLQLEDHVAGAVEGLHVAIAPAAAGPRLLGAVEDATLRGWLQRCAQLGISPHAVVPDCLLLPEADDGTLLAAPAGDMLAVRGPRLAFTAEPGLARAIAGARPLRMLEPGEAEARFAAAAAGEPPLDLLQYGHARRDPRARRRRRRLAVLAALALCSPVLVDGALALRYALGAHWM